MSSFADGLRDFNTIGALVEPVRLNNSMRELIRELMGESLENTSVKFPEPEDEDRYNEFMQSMDFLGRLIKKGANRNKKMPRHIAKTLHFWITSELKHHHLSDHPEFEDALQWITNHISKHYSVSMLVNDR